MRKTRIVGLVAAGIFAAGTASVAHAGQPALVHKPRVINITFEGIDNPADYITLKTARALTGALPKHGPAVHVFVTRHYSSSLPTQVMLDGAGLYYERYLQEVAYYQKTGIDHPARVPSYCVLRYRPRSIGWINCRSDRVVDTNGAPVMDPLVPRQKVVIEPDLDYFSQRVDGYKRVGSTSRRRYRALRASVRAAKQAWHVKRHLDHVYDPAHYCRQMPRALPSTSPNLLESSAQGRAAFTYKLGHRRVHGKVKTMSAGVSWAWKLAWGDGTERVC
jgi:hypothetical protein